MSLSSLDENGAKGHFDYALLCMRLGLYAQLAMAVGCMMLFEEYLRTRSHPLGWKESAVRVSHTFSLPAFFVVITVSGFARIPIWRRLVWVIASFILAGIINEVYWGAIVRY